MPTFAKTTLVQLNPISRRPVREIRTASGCLQECSKFGIAGRSVRSELQALRRQLPPLFEAAVAALRQPPVQQAADYYAAFIEFAHGREAAVAGGRLLPTLAEVVAGATAPSADSAQHGEEPSRSVSVNNLQVSQFSLRARVHSGQGCFCRALLPPL